MPSSSVQDTFASALDGEGAHVARRARSSSSTSSSARSRSSKRARNSGMRRASSPPATPTIAGATSSALTINVKKKRRHKKARQDEDAAREAARLPPQLPQLCQPHLLHGAPAAPSLLQQRFSEVELQFQLEQDRAQRSALAPRDIANLILWSVPAPVPIIESPRIFFIKNKSKVRNTVVIYVNGWSYDEMLCTGVGLPRARGEVERGGAPREQAAPSHSTDAMGNATGHAAASAAPAANAAGDGPAAHWNTALCSAMLGPVREGRCWARPGRGTGGAGGVQYCPLSIPSTRNELEKDLWWRNDAPRRPGPSSAASSSALNRWRPNRSCGGEDGDRGVADLHLTSPAVKGARGVGSMFQQAMQVHATGSGAGDGAASAERSPKAASAPAADSPIIASDAFQQHQHLWQNRTLLQRYALHLPEHTVEMQELGFTVSPPQESTAAVRADGGSAEEDDKETALPKGNEERGEQDMVEVEGGESALARATLIDVLTGNVVLDLLVKPRQRITDYRTRFSGIDAATLAPVSTTLADCQHALQRIVDSQTFVVGHSLENDFKACKCIPNCYVLDTTWLFPHPAGLPYKNALRFLAQRYLQRRIQHGSHDSAIDALVSAELTQLKLINGPSFGMRARVSVLGLITEAAGSAADGVRAGEGPEKTTEAGFDVQLHLFDDAVTLASLLPAPQKYDAASATQAGASGGTVSGAPRSSSASSARIDAVPVRHDEDGMRKAVRALQRRASQQAREAAVAANDTDGETATTQRPNFSLFWVQLAQAKVDVVLPPAQPPTASAAVAAEEESETAERAAYAGHGGSRGTGSAHTVAQFRRVHDTNRRVLRIIEACPDETLIVVLTGRCDGEAGGNHFSRAQGTCFAFVKDSSAPGPRPEELTKLTDGSSVSALPRMSAAGTAVDNIPLQNTSALATAAVPHSLDREAAMVVHTPLACQQQ
ncbi:Exonuclease family protein [Leishmania donovani]|uniref:Exonuclease family protein n=1 Tax=Leishmania donovani TaxID=5661 RepID=A0A504XG35_LEIDO|nr:Exonuclease family protein [Leishmania donovani]